MSNYWELYCIDCKKCLDLEWNHGGELLTKFINQNGPKLVAQLNAIDLGMYHLETRFDCGPTQNVCLIHWCLEHCDHEIVARDEYGSLFSECAKVFSCQHCKGNLTCKLEKNHQGDHRHVLPD